MSFHGLVSRLVAPCAGLALSGLAAGCTFPGVTFGDAPDGGGTVMPHTDATAPDVMGFGDDDGPAADVSTSVGAERRPEPRSTSTADATSTARGQPASPST